MSPTEAAPVAPRPRRRLALSLRMLMALVLVAGSWLAWKANRARDQKRAVDAILRTGGGEVLYDWQEPIVNNNPRPGAAIPGPTFLRRLLGDEYFQDITFVRVGGRGRVPAGTLEAIGRLPNARKLNLAMLRLDPDDLAPIARMTSLRALSLGNTRLTDEALARLAGLTNLEELYIHWSDVRDGTRHLAGMTRLRVLTLSHSRLGDAGLAHLAALPGLREVTLHDNPVSDPAVRRFRAARPDVQVEYASPNPPRPSEIEPRPL